jgi:hypothetical protein
VETNFHCFNTKTLSNKNEKMGLFRHILAANSSWLSVRLSTLCLDVCVSIIPLSNRFINLPVYSSIRPSIPTHSPNYLISPSFKSRGGGVWQNAWTSRNALQGRLLFRKNSPKTGCLVSVLHQMESTSRSANDMSDTGPICVGERERNDTFLLRGNYGDFLLT